MLTSTHGADYMDIESRLRTGAPGKRDAATGARVRGLVVRQRHTSSFVRIGFVAATAVMVVMAALVWSSESRIAPSAAFAYDQAVQVLAPEDGVLHFKTSSLQTPIEPTMLLKDHDVTVTVEYPPDTTETMEMWIDASRSVFREEYSLGYPPMAWRIVQDPDRVLVVSDHDSRWLDVEEHLTGGSASNLDDVPSGWLGWGLTQSFSTALENRSCEVTEDVAPDGTEVWRVTWKEEPELVRLPEEVLAGFDAEARADYEDQLLDELSHAPVKTCVALFRRSDYRPLTVDVHSEYPPGYSSGIIPGPTDTHIEVEVWEVLPADDVPADLFETRADLGNAAASYAIDMTPDDPRIAEIGFPVWKARDDLGLGLVSSTRFCQGAEAMNGGYLVSFDLQRSGMLTVFYGDSDPWAASPDLVGITTFASNDADDVEEYWAGQLPGVDETTGEVDAHAYRMRSTDAEALLLTAIDDEIVVISGPDEDTILDVLGALELWE